MRAVDEGIAKAPVGRVEELTKTGRTSGDVGRDELETFSVGQGWQDAKAFLPGDATRLDVDLVDARTGTLLCPVRPLDKSANADGQRRALQPLGPQPSAMAPSSGMAPLLRQLLADCPHTAVAEMVDVVHLLFALLEVDEILYDGNDVILRQRGDILADAQAQLCIHTVAADIAKVISFGVEEQTVK